MSIRDAGYLRKTSMDVWMYILAIVKPLVKIFLVESDSLSFVNLLMAYRLRSIASITVQQYLNS